MKRHHMLILAHVWLAASFAANGGPYMTVFCMVSAVLFLVYWFLNGDGGK